MRKLEFGALEAAISSMASYQRSLFQCGQYLDFAHSRLFASALSIENIYKRFILDCLVPNAPFMEDGIMETTKRLIESLADAKHLNYGSLEHMTDSFAATLDSVRKSATEIQFEELDLQIFSTLDDTLHYAEKAFLHNGAAEQLEEIRPEIESLRHAPITFERVVGLINLIIAIITMLISMCPSEQIDRIIEQNELQIAQNNVIIEQNQSLIENQEAIIALSKNDEELREILSDLVDTLQPLGDIAQIIKDKQDGAPDPSEPQEQTEEGDTVTNATQ